MHEHIVETEISRCTSFPTQQHLKYMISQRLFRGKNYTRFQTRFEDCRDRFLRTVPKHGKTGYERAFVSKLTDCSAEAAKVEVWLDMCRDLKCKTHPIAFFSLLLGPIVCLAFSPTYHSFFVDDDFMVLAFVHNPNVSMHDFFAPYLSVPVGIFFRPLALSYYYLSFQLFQFVPTGYHLMNVLMHFGNALLIYSLGKRLVDKVHRILSWHSPCELTSGIS